MGDQGRHREGGRVLKCLHQTQHRTFHSHLFKELLKQEVDCCWRLCDQLIQARQTGVQVDVPRPEQSSLTDETKQYGNKPLEEMHICYKDAEIGVAD